MGTCCGKSWADVDLNALIFGTISMGICTALIFAYGEETQIHSIASYMLWTIMGIVVGSIRAKPKAKVDADLLNTIPSVRPILEYMSQRNEFLTPLSNPVMKEVVVPEVR